MGFISNNRNQMELFGFSLDDFIPNDAKCRFIVDIVSKLDLTELYNRYSAQGNDAFEPSAMLATWFFAYSDTITSTRKVEEKCQRDLHYMYVSANLKPDHTSLSRFRKNHLDLLADYFLQIVKMAKESGVDDFKTISIDGSKIQAASSAKNSKTSEELAAFLQKVRKDIEEYMRQCDALDEDSIDTDSLKEVQRKIEHLKEMEKTLLTRQKELEIRKSSLKPEHCDKHKINTIEPDARNMNKVNGNQKLPAYNTQISVTTKTQLIAANDVQMEANDFNQLDRQHQNTESNLGSDPSRCYLFDAGYHNLDQLEYVYTNQLNVFLASPRPEKTSQQSLDEKKTFTREDFVYNKENDCYECPAGNQLFYENDYRKGHKWFGRVYKTDACSNCHLKAKCLKPNQKKNQKRIRREHREYLAELNYDKCQTDQAKQMQKLRSTTVEPAFGNLKSNLGFRRFSLMGLENVKGEFNLMCIAHNLNKLFLLMGSLCPTIQKSIDYLIILCQRTMLHYLQNNFKQFIPLKAVFN